MGDNITGEVIESRPNRIFSDLWNHRHDNSTEDWWLCGIAAGTEIELIKFPTQQSLRRFLIASNA